MTVRSISMPRRRAMILGVAGAALASPALRAQALPTVDVVVGPNLGHLPLFVGVAQGHFRQHGLDVRLKTVPSGTEMVAAMAAREVELGDMSVTTFLKARHRGDPLVVIGLVMNDGTTAFADTPLAIIARGDAGIAPGAIEALRGRRVGVNFEQTPDEYLRMVLSRRGIRPEELTLVPIRDPDLGAALSARTIDAAVSLEPVNAAITRANPGSIEVLRGGGHLSYMMPTTAHLPTLTEKPALLQAFTDGLAAASFSTRKDRDAAVEAFVSLVPNADASLAKAGIRHVAYDPRITKHSLQAFADAQETLIRLTLGATTQPLPLASLVVTRFAAETEARLPQYFADLPPIPA